METAAIIAAGILAWTFIEYGIHAWLSHTFATFATPLHDLHHRDPHAVFTVGAWLPLAVAWMAGFAVFRFAPGMIFFSAMLGGFIAYEVIHYRLHFCIPQFAIAQDLRARHLLHHAHNPDACFGVTSGLWDLIFGTELFGPAAEAFGTAAASTPPLTGPSNMRKIFSYWWPRTGQC